MTDISSLDLRAMGPLIAAATVFLGGVISAFNPCCYPMFPAIVVLVGNQRKAQKVKAGVIAVLFVLGFALATTIMGALSVGFGMVFGKMGATFNYLVAIIPIVMALHLFRVIQLQIPFKSTQERTYEGWFGAVITGFTFAFVIVPCATPILASVLAYAAYKQSLTYGSFLLFLYGIGVGIPLIIMGSFMGLSGVAKYTQKHTAAIRNLTGVGLVAIGLYLIWQA